MAEEHCLFQGRSRGLSRKGGFEAEAVRDSESDGTNLVGCQG